MGGRGQNINSSANNSGGATLNGVRFDYDGNLKYDKIDNSLSKSARDSIIKWESKRQNSKVEYAFVTDENGVAVANEIRGGKKSTRIYSSMFKNNGILTHIHPRDNINGNHLGGTFSEADLQTLGMHDIKTIRAVAKEGTYSISKTNNFKRSEFLSYINGMDRKMKMEVSKQVKPIHAEYYSGKITREEANKRSIKVFNTQLVKMHNDLIDNASKYGYNYTLERR